MNGFHAEKRRELVHRGLDAGSDIERAGVGRVGDREIRRHHITDINEIARLFAVTVDRCRLAAQLFIDEDCHDAGFALRVLPRAIHVRVTQGDGPEAVHGAKIVHVVLHSELRAAVRRKWIRRMLLSLRRKERLTVNRAAGRGENEALDSELHGLLQQPHAADNIHISIEDRIGNRAPNVHLRGMMVDHIGTDFVERRLANVALVKFGARIQIATITGR